MNNKKKKKTSNLCKKLLKILKVVLQAKMAIYAGLL